MENDKWDAFKIATDGVPMVDAGTGSIQLLAYQDVVILSDVGQISLTSNSGQVTTSNLEGLVYTSDYTSTFVTNSLVTKGYVDSISYSTTIGGTNGIVEYSTGIIGLGGTLSQNTLIDGNGFDFIFANAFEMRGKEYFDFSA